MPTKGSINPAIRDVTGKIIPWKKRNREAANASTRARRALTPEKVRAENRSYRENNPFAVAVIVARNRAKQLGVESTLTREEWESVVKERGSICHVCGSPTSYEIGSPDTLSLDHLLPMSRGGNNSKENVAPAHRRCNQNRTNMTLDEFDGWLKKVIKYRSLYES
jgi:5-methylcytosine-specific restriction endonuclease McrA